jgi:hypothetical protein
MSINLKVGLEAKVLLTNMLNRCTIKETNWHISRKEEIMTIAEINDKKAIVVGKLCESASSLSSGKFEKKLHSTEKAIQALEKKKQEKT